MEELSMMEQVSRGDKDHFHHNDPPESHPPNMTNGISSPSELSDMSTDTTTSPFSPKTGCSSPIGTYYRGYWHPHIYSKPARIPTPHGITDILNLSTDDQEEAEEEDVDPKELDEESLSSPSPSSPLTLEMDEPLNLTVVKRPISSSSPLSEANNNNRVVNGNGGRGILGPRNLTGKKRTKSPINSLLNVIIPKVKNPKISSFGSKNGTKSSRTKGKPFFSTPTYTLTW